MAVCYQLHAQRILVCRTASPISGIRTLRQIPISLSMRWSSSTSTANSTTGPDGHRGRQFRSRRRCVVRRDHNVQNIRKRNEDARSTTVRLLGGEPKRKSRRAWRGAWPRRSARCSRDGRAAIILRLLTRDIPGFMSIPSAVVTVLLVIVDSGFSQSLSATAAFAERLQVGFPSSTSLFLAVFYGCWWSGVFAARWYGARNRADRPGFFPLLLPLNALCAVQNTIFIRCPCLHATSKDLPFAAGGGLTAIAVLAMAGKHLEPRGGACDRGRDATALWWLSDWRPAQARVSLRRWRRLGAA